MTRFFHDLAGFFMGLYRAIIWFVLLVALLLVAYCAVRGMDMAYDYVNRHWFSGDDSIKLVIAAALLMGVGILIETIRRIRRLRNGNPPDHRWPLDRPPRGGER